MMKSAIFSDELGLSLISAVLGVVILLVLHGQEVGFWIIVHGWKTSSVAITRIIMSVCTEEINNNHINKK